MVRLVVHVEDLKTGKPLAGARITIDGAYPKTTYDPGWREWYLTDNRTYRVEATRDGYYTQSVNLDLGKEEVSFVFRLLEVPAPPPPPPPVMPTTEIACRSAGYYWYQAACHKEPEPPPAPTPPGEWPWPLNLVKGWFDSFWNWVGTAAVNAVQPVSDWILSSVTSITGFVSTSTAWIWDQIRSALTPITARLEDIGGWFTEKAVAFLKDPVGSLNSSFQWLSAQVSDKFTAAKTYLETQTAWLGEEVTRGFTGLSTFVGDRVAWVEAQTRTMFDGAMGTLGSWLEDALKGVADALGSGLQGFGDWILKHLTWFNQMIIGAVNAVVAAVQSFVLDMGKRFVDSLTGIYTPGSPDEELENTMAVMVETMNSRIVDEIKGMYASPAANEKVMATAASVATLLGVGILSVKVLAASADAAHPTKDIGFKDVATDMIASTGAAIAMSSILRMPADVGLLAPLRYAYNHLFTPAVPDASTLAGLTTERLITAPEYYDNMRYNGLNEFWADRILQSLWKVPGFQELSLMLWRGKISAEALQGALRASGVREDFMDAYMSLTEAIPGSGDLITMMVREVLDMAQFNKYMLMQGWTTFWANAYYEMHWILLPLGEVRRARHRGLVDDDELSTFLRLHDYRPEARPGIRTSDRDLAASMIWDLPGAIDARWMFRWGFTDRDGLRDLLVKGGLDPAYVEDVADAVAMNQFLREIRLQETNIKADLRDGLITEETARADLRELRYPDVFVEYHVADALRDRDRTYKRDLLDFYLDGYMKDLVTEEEFENRTREIILVPEVAALYLKKAYVNKYKKPKAS